MSTDTPEAETQSRDLRSATDAILQRIGPYKILETLGEGGFVVTRMYATGSRVPPNVRLHAYGAGQRCRG